MQWSPWTKIAIKKGYFSERLPEFDGPAIYQLGIGSPQGGTVTIKYLGKADNLRKRITQYAGASSHLGDVIDPNLRRGKALYYRYYRVNAPEKLLSLEKTHLRARKYDWNIQNNVDD